MTKCKKINQIDGVVAKVVQDEGGRMYAEYSFMMDGESLARVRLSEEQVHQFHVILDKVESAMTRAKISSEYRIVD